jgi:RNA polymerase sigma-70 factor, ECF subfamily
MADRDPADRTPHVTLKPSSLHHEFTALYLRWWPVAWSAARMHLFCDADADGAAQKIFLRLWAKGQAAWPRTHPETFFRNAGRNEALMILRRHGPLEQFDDRLARILTASDATPCEYTEGMEALETIGVAIAELPPRCRQVLALVVFEGLTNTEIAERLGISVGAVEKQRARARRILRERLPPNLLPISDRPFSRTGGARRLVHLKSRKALPFETSMRFLRTTLLPFDEMR